MKDYYQILGVSRDADPKTIKSAYRRLIMKYHPDKNSEPGAEEKFKEIQKAYDVLSDVNKKAQYDQYGHDAFEQQSNNQRNYQYGGFNSDFYQSNVNARMVRMKELPWYLKILMAIVIFVIIVGFIIFAIISTIIAIIIKLINNIFK